MHPLAAAPGPRRAALGFIFVTILLDMMAIGLIVPVLPSLFKSFLAGDEMRAAKMAGLFGTAWAAMQLFCSPVLGLLSDRFGRRPVILLSNLSLGLDYVIMALAPTLGWLFIGRLLSGITSASVSTAHAYISDVTPPEKRAGAFGLLGAAFGAGFILGPALGGWLGATNPRLPFWLAAGFSLANAAYGFFILPESLPRERRQPALRWKDANPLGSLKLLHSHPELLGLATVNFLGYVAHQIYAVVFVFYAQHRYDWDERQVGGAMALVGVASVIISGGIVRWAVARFGERRALFAGLTLGALGFAMFGWAPAGWIFVLAIPLNCLWALAGPPSLSMMTRRVSPSEQGELQGANGFVRSLAMIIGPWVFGYIYGASIDPHRAVPMPGAPWYVAAALLLVALAVARAAVSKAGSVGAAPSEVAEAQAS